MSFFVGRGHHLTSASRVRDHRSVTFTTLTLCARYRWEPSRRFVFREALVTWLNALPHHRAGAIVYHRWPFKRPRTADASPAFPAGHFESQSPNRIR